MYNIKDRLKKDFIKQETKLNEYAKNYRQNNKDIIKARNKIYYENNKDKIKQRQKNNYIINNFILTEKVNCDICGLELQRRSLKRHIKKHQIYVKSDLFLK